MSQSQMNKMIYEIKLKIGASLDPKILERIIDQVTISELKELTMRRK